MVKPKTCRNEIKPTNVGVHQVHLVKMGIEKSQCGYARVFYYSQLEIS
jgi:hypothetical protein